MGTHVGVVCLGGWCYMYSSRLLIALDSITRLLCRTTFISYLLLDTIKAVRSRSRSPRAEPSRIPSVSSQQSAVSSQQSAVSSEPA